MRKRSAVKRNSWSVDDCDGDDGVDDDVDDEDIHDFDADDDLVEYEANGESPHWPKRVNGADRAVPLLYRHSHLM